MVTRATFCVAVAALLAVSVTASAQHPRPNPKPASPRNAAAPLPGRLLVSVDDDAMVSVNGQPAVRFRAGEVKTIPVGLGRHMIRAVSVRAADAVAEQVADIAAPGQQVVQLALKARADVLGRMSSRRNRPRAPHGSPVVAVVDIGLAEAGAAYAAGLQPLRVWLQSTDGQDLGEPAPESDTALHAEVQLIGEATAPVAGDQEMHSCTVNVRLMIFNGPRPVTSPFSANGAAFTGARACATARQRAVGAAAAALAAYVRKELR